MTVTLLNSMIRLHLRIQLENLNPSKKDLPNHLKADLEFPQNFIPTAKARPMIT